MNKIIFDLYLLEPEYKKENIYPSELENIYHYSNDQFNLKFNRVKEKRSRKLKIIVHNENEDFLRTET